MDAVRTTADDAIEAIEAMLATDPRQHRFLRGSGWPAVSREDASAVLAAILEDRHLSQWTFVTAGQPDGEADGHAWLEWRRKDGTVAFSIDPTLHQFPGWSERFIGVGVTPAASVFSVMRWEGAVWERPWLGEPYAPLPRLIEAVRFQLKRRESSADQGFLWLCRWNFNPCVLVKIPTHV